MKLKNTFNKFIKENEFNYYFLTCNAFDEIDIYASMNSDLDDADFILNNNIKIVLGYSIGTITDTIKDLDWLLNRNIVREKFEILTSGECYAGSLKIE